MEALHIVYHMLSESERVHVQQISVADENRYHLHTGKLTLTPFIVVKGNTSMAKAIVAHEAAHIQQNLWWFGRYTQAVLSIWLLCFTIGFIYTIAFLYSFIALVTLWLSLLIAEAHANYRAYKWLKSQKCANMKIVKKVLLDSLFSYIKPF